MRGSFYLRAAATVALVTILSLGLWQCARETTGSGSGGLQLALDVGSPTAEVVDSVAIDVLRGGEVVTAQTAPVIDGRFTATLVATAGEDYLVRAYGLGEGPDLEPGAVTRGVLAFGEATDVTLRPGRLTEVSLPLSEARPRVVSVSGAIGYDTLRVQWTPTAGASHYTLGWHAGEEGTAGSQGPIDGETVSLTFETPGVAALLTGELDSIAFHVRPHFGARAGVFGPDTLVNLGRWMDLPHLVSIYPGHGAIVEHDTASVWLGFSRPMADTSVVKGVRWREASTSSPIRFLLEVLTTEPTHFRLAPLDGELDYATEYEVTISSTVTDTLGRPFDASPDTPGLQAATVRWITTGYDPLDVAALDPPPGSSDVDPTAPLRVTMNRPIDVTTLNDTTCYVAGSGGEKMPGALSTSATADTILWEPAPGALWFDTNYTLHVTTDLKDERGRPLDHDAQTYPALEPYSASFVTAAQPPGPRVDEVDPPHDARAVPIGASVVVTFSEPVDSNSVRVLQTFKVKENGQASRQGVLAKSTDQRTYTFTPNTPLSASTRYVVVIETQVTNLEGVRLDQDRETPGYDPFSSEFFTEGPPRVEQSDPADGAVRVAIEQVVTLDFSDEIDPASVTEQTVRLLQDSAPVDCARSLATDSLSLAITPAAPLAYLTSYRVVVDTLVTAADGSRLDQDPETPGKQPFELRFTTEPESINPHVTLVVPADGAIDVPVSVQPQAFFSEAIDPSTVQPNTVYLSRLIGPSQTEGVAGALAVATDSLSVTFSPDAALHNGATYELVVSSLVESRHGFRLDQDPEEPLFQDFTSEFVTEPERIAPRAIDSDPRDGDTAVPREEPVQVLFSEPMQAESLPGAFSLSAGGVDVDGAGALDQEGEVWTFTPQEPLDWNTTYTAQVDTTALDLAGNRFDQDPEAAGRQPFAFAFTTVTDTVPPRVTSMDPPNGSSGVGVEPSDTLRVTFSEALLTASLSAESFRVEGPGGQAVDGAASLTQGGRVVAWAPDDSLAFATTYTVTADTLLTDLPGNRLDQDGATPEREPFVGSFTTKQETIPPRVIASTPSAGAGEVPIDTEVTLAFSEPMDGSTIPGAFALTVDGIAAGGSGSLGAGDSVWTFIPDAPLAYAAACTVRVDTTATDPAGNLLDQDPQQPYRQPFLLAFTTAPDRESPAAIAIEPPDGSTGVGVQDTIRVTFSEPLLAGSVTAEAFRVEVEGGAAADGTLLLEQDQRVIAWVPAVALAFDTTYTVTADTLLQDLAGNGLDQDPAAPGRQAFTASLRTQLETIPPQVVDADPADGAVDVEIDAVVSLTFSEPMAPASVTDAFALRLAGQAVDGLGELDPGGTAWTFTPADSLQRSSTYIVFVDTTAVDLVGNGLDQDPGAPGRQPFEITFATVADTVSPRALAMDPASGADSVSVTLDSLKLVLSEPLDPATVDPSAFSVSPAGEDPLAGTLLLAGGDTTIVWIPADTLEFSTTYEVLADTTLTDRAGNGLDQDPGTPGRQPYAGFFITMPENIPPTVIGVEPESPWPVDVEPTIFFSEPMDTLSLREPDVVRLLDDGLQALPFTMTIASSADTVTITPDALLIPGEYSLWVSTDALDQAGNHLDQDPETPILNPFWESFEVEE